MEIEKLQIALKPRTNWEAADLGIKLAMRWFLPLLLAWTITALPFLGLALLWFDGLVAQLIFLWWFKPVYERSVLMWLSRFVFDDRPTWESTVAGFRSMRLFFYVSVARLSWCRAGDSPVDAVEDLDLGSAGRRRRNLYEYANRVDFVVTLFGLLFEVTLVFLFVMLFTLFTQSDFNSAYAGWLKWVSIDEIPQWKKLYLLGSAFVAMAIGGVIYVSIGFSTYLNRRTIKEAWDIQLGFTKLVNRLGVVVLAVCLVTINSDLAAQTQNQGQDRYMSVHDVLAGPEFNQTREISVPEPLVNLLSELETEAFSGERKKLRTNSFFAAVIKFLFITLLILALAFLFYKLYRNYGLDWTSSEEQKTEIGPSAGLQSLPRNHRELIDRYWKAGKLREAVALLYRAAVKHVDTRFACEIEASDTEVDCTRKSRKIESNAREAFKAITALWVKFAYGQQTPSKQEFDHALARFDRYIAVN